MTTIAYDCKSLVSDSRSCIGSMIYEEDCQKIYPDVGPFVVLGIAGDLQDAMDIIDAISTFTTLDQIRSIDYNVTKWHAAIIGITANGSVWHYVGEDSFELRPDIPFALGSGAVYALAAMDLGKTAEEAVKYASTRDLYTNEVTQVATLLSHEETDEDTNEDEDTEEEKCAQYTEH